MFRTLFLPTLLLLYFLAPAAAPLSGQTETEPNDVLLQANPIISSSSINGIIGSTADRADWFISVPDDDGELRIQIDYTYLGEREINSISATVLDQRGRLIGGRSTNNVSPGTPVRESFSVPCRQRDTFYIQLFSSTTFRYTLSYSLRPAAEPADAEPNNTFQTASPYEAGVTQRGRIGFLGRDGADRRDYYRLIMPEDGTLTFPLTYFNENSRNGQVTASLYDANNRIIGSKSLIDVPPGASVRDTLRVHCRQRDTVFLELFSANCFSYSFSYEHTPPRFAGDAEPNGRIAEANITAERGVFTGRLRYFSRTGLDNLDVFAIPTNGTRSLQFALEGEHLDSKDRINTTWRLFRKNGSQLGSKTITGIRPGQFRDTLLFPCVTADTVYLVIGSTGCISYRITTSSRDESPTPSIAYSRFGNTFAFRPETRRNETLLWDFGDGTVTDAKYPTKSFPPGVHDVRLEVDNETCRQSTVVTERLEISGIETYSPKRAGQADNLGFFFLRVFGAGLSRSTKVTLSRGGRRFNPVSVRSPGTAEATAQFSLQDLAIGTYDLRFELDNGEVYVFPEGFTIYADEPGFSPVVNVIGPPRIRNNRWTDFTIRATNDRGRTLTGLPVVIVTPPNVETNILDIVERKSGRYVIKGDEWDKLTIPEDYWNEVLWNGDFDPDRDTVEINYDQINENLEDYVLLDIDSLFGEPLVGTGYLIYLHDVPANGTADLKFRIRSPETQNIEIVAFPLLPNVRRNPVDLCTADQVKDYTLMACSILEFVPSGYLQKVAANAGKLDIGSQVAAQVYYDRKYNTNSIDANFIKRQTLAAAGELFGDVLPTGKKTERLQRSLQRGKSIRSKILSKQKKNIQQFARRINKSNPFKREELTKEFDLYIRRIEKLDALASDNQKLLAVNALATWAQKKGLSLEVDGLLETFVEPEPEPIKTNEPKTIKKTPVRSVTSFDPNEIYGNAGVGRDRFLRRQDALEYTVAFENVDTAEAAAQIVRITLTLNPEKYDLARTTLGDVFFGGNYYTIEEDRCEYFRDIDLRPAQDLFVRFQGKIDTLSGRIEWQFTSLDPETMDLPQGINDGFLPPNVMAPEGDGSVSFVTFARADLASGDTLATDALIFFDDNAPIQTNRWSNVVDEDLPTSRLDQTVTTIDDSTFIINYSAVDATSGVEEYELFYRRRGFDWTDGAPLAADGSTQVFGIPGATYDFYVIAQDSVGNREIKEPRAELTVTNGLVGIRSAPVAEPLLRISPNPAASATVAVELPARAREVNVELVDTRGRLVRSYADLPVADRQIDLRLTGVPTGFYVVRVRYPSGRAYTGKLSIVNP